MHLLAQTGAIGYNGESALKKAGRERKSICVENVWIVVNQVLIMSIIVMVGFVLVRFGKLSPGVTVSMSNLLIYAVLPCVIIGTMQRDFQPDEALLLLFSALLAALAYFIFILIAQLFLRRSKRQNTGVERFALVQPNTGYIGIPLVQAVLGKDGVFLLTAYIVLFNLIAFSYGRYQLSCDGEERGLAKAVRPLSAESIRRSLVNPASVSVAIGLTLYLLNLRLPDVLLSTMDALSGLNSVISMLLIGIFLTQIDVHSLFQASRLWRVLLISLLRLIVLPFILMLVLAALDMSWLGANEDLLKTTIVIAASTPVAVAASFMAELYGGDNLYGANLAVVSTILSVVTMPLMILLWTVLSAIL